MQPAARAAAAIEVLDRILGGESAERALTAWGRASRYAGSGDRAAVRDIVFEALRQKRSANALGGGAGTGRALVLGLARGQDLEATWFAGIGHGPAPAGDDELALPCKGAESLDIPDWLEPLLQEALGQDYPQIAEAMRHRAPVTLRVNAARAQPAAAIARLKAEGIEAKPHPLAKFALEVTGGARKIQNSSPYNDGLVELQDAASQAVIEALPLQDGLRVLDHCAGGGGKTLALAARADLQIWAHDISSRRMSDIPLRAKRAGVEVTLTENPEALPAFDLILTDVPCSGAGSWRRDPEGKWALTAERLEELVAIQASIMDRTAKMVKSGGVLAYATCSFLRQENEAQVEGFLARHSGWSVEKQQRFSPLQGGDGFYFAILRKGYAD